MENLWCNNVKHLLNVSRTEYLLKGECGVTIVGPRYLTPT